MTTILVSFLGTGNYKPGQYTLAGQVAQTTPFVQVAQCELLGIKRAIILVTDGPNGGSREKNWPKLFEELQQFGVGAEAVSIPTCANEREFWELFRILSELLQRHSGDEVILDITHSFRTIPFFAGAVLMFQRLTRSGTSNVSRILYGEGPSFDHPTTAPPPQLPIWDLSSFLELLDWSQALGQFLETGNANRLGTLTETLGTKEVKIANEQKDHSRRDAFRSLKTLGKTLKEVSLNLAGNRTKALLVDETKSNCSVARALSNIKESRSLIQSELPPLAFMLDKIQTMLEPMSQGFVHGQDGMKSWLHLAKLYLEFGRYADCSATLREGLINLNLQMDQVFVKDSRNKTHAGLGILAQTIMDMRNDLNHCGYRSNPTDAKCMTDSLEGYIQQIESAVFAPVFVNLSNHPSQKWSEEQIKAVMSVPCTYAPITKIEDVDFPMVDPEASTTDLAKISEKVINDLPKGTVSALVQGEYILSSLLVKGLQQRGIACYTATTHRNVIDLPDGKKLTEFKFVRLREYPGMGGVANG